MALPGVPDPDRAERPVVAIAEIHAAASSAPRHTHMRAQLIFVMSGALRLETDEGLHLVPPGRAAWIPGGVPHRADYPASSAVRVAYVDGAAFPDLPERCVVFALTGLLRELVERAVALGWEWPPGGAAERVMRLLVDEIGGLTPVGLFLPHGRDPRLKRVVAGLEADPGDGRRIEDWAVVAGTSARTLARLFRAETGLSFATWREQLRLTRAVERLAAGDSVTRIALDLGYGSTGSFSTMFGRSMGLSPRAWVAAAGPAGRRPAAV